MAMYYYSYKKSVKISAYVLAISDNNEYDNILWTISIRANGKICRQTVETFIEQAALKNAGEKAYKDLTGAQLS